jgi:hypothetical protein
MNNELTTEEKIINDNLHKEHPELMKKAYKAFCRHGKYYGGLYGYQWKGYARFSKDIFVLARMFENDYAEVMLKNQKVK